MKTEAKFLFKQGMLLPFNSFTVFEEKVYVPSCEFMGFVVFYRNT